MQFHRHQLHQNLYQFQIWVRWFVRQRDWRSWHHAPNHGHHQSSLQALCHHMSPQQPIHNPSVKEEKRQLDATMKRRTAKPTLLEVATFIADNQETTDRLSETLAARYSLPADERHRYRTMLQAMRVAQRHLIMRIRRAYPFGGGNEKQQQFLNWLQETALEIEGRTSDNLI